MRVWRRILLGVGGLAATLIVSGLVVLRWPQLVVNDSMLELLRSRLLPRLDIELAWRDAHIAVTSIGWLEKQIRVTLADVALQHPKAVFTAPMVAAAIDITVFHRNWRPVAEWLTGVGPIAVAGGSLDLRTSSEGTDPVASGEPSVDPDVTLRLLASRRWEPVSVELERLSIDGRQGVASLRLRKAAEGLFELDADARGTGRKPLGSLGLHALIGLHEVDGRMRPAIDADLQVALVPRSRGVAAVRLSLQPPSERSDLGWTGVPGGAGAHRLRMDGEYRAAGQQLAASFVGGWQPRGGEIAGSLQLRVEELAGRRLQTSFGPCAVDARSADYLTDDIKLSLQCSGRGIIPVSVAPNELQALLPRALTYAVDADLSVMRSDDGTRLEFRATTQLDRTIAGPLSVDGSARIAGRFRLDAPRQPEQLTADFDLDAWIPELGALARQLAKTKLAIWAPLNQLRGEAGCSVKGHVDLVREALYIPFQCRSGLRSSDQALIARAEGQLRLVPGKQNGLRPDIRAAIELADVRVVLPDLDLRSRQIPRLLPDRRIVSQAARTDRHRERKDRSRASRRRDELLPMTYDLHVRTTRPEALRVASRIVDADVPLAVDLRLSRSPEQAAAGLEPELTGDVEIGAFDLALLRRAAKVKRFRMVFNGAAATTLDGRVEIPSSDYQIYLNVLGTTAEPRYVLRTDPPVPEQDAIALLIFGRTPELMDDDALRSAEETRAAIADSAISLLTMYWLAATPVESIGYNPYTQVMTARIRLQAGLTLVLGRGEDESVVGLRRRVGRNWMIETKTVRMPGEEGSRGVAMLTWGKRY